MISSWSDVHLQYSLWNLSRDALNLCNTNLTACVHGMFRCCPVYDIFPFLTYRGSPSDSLPSVWHLDIMRPESQAHSKTCNFLYVTSCIKGLFTVPMAQWNQTLVTDQPAGSGGPKPGASLLLPPGAMYSILPWSRSRLCLHCDRS